MPKGWAAWPRSVRWLIGGTATVVLALAIVWALFVPAADWLAHHDVGSAKGPLHETALDNARGRLLTLGAGLFAARNFTLSRHTVELTRRTFELTEQGQVTDRYTKAIEQLGSDKLDVRIGGIYALERVARDSARDHPTVMEVLTAFIREHSREQWPLSDPGSQERERSTRPDVQAAVTVVGRRDRRRDIRGRHIVLSGAVLSGAVLSGANLTGAVLYVAVLSGADLTGADLSGADLTRADLSGADLRGAVLSGATLAEADLRGAFLSGTVLFGATLAEADLRGAFLSGQNLTGALLSGQNLTVADLTRADLSGADLTRADLSGADLSGADLSGADLTGADLTGAKLCSVDDPLLDDANLRGANLTRANLDAATWPSHAPPPEGWKLDADSGRLMAAGSDTAPPQPN